MKNTRQGLRFLYRFVGIFALVFGLAANLQAGTTLSSVESGGNVTITGFSGTDSAVVIPGTINSLPVTAIAASAFQNCTGITSLTIPSSVVSIGSSALSGCTKLASIILPDGVSVIGDSTFSGCTSLASISLPASLTSVGNSAFQGCSKLPSVVIPTGVTSIGNAAFQSCTLLTSATLPSTLLTLGTSVFNGCNKLASISLPNGITTIPTSTFVNCSLLANVTLPNALTSVGNSAFQNCSALTGITLPNTVTTIASQAFMGCTALTNITLPSTLTTIASQAFQNTGLTSISIPASVTSIALTAFAVCNNLASVTVSPSNAKYTDASLGALFDKAQTTLITVPAKKAGPTFTAPVSVGTIAASAFLNCGSLTSIAISGSVTIINDSTFSGCGNLASVSIPATVGTIAANAFLNCSKLTGITLPANLTTIGNSAFQGCSLLANVTLPSGVKSIGINAFQNCTKLTSLAIPDSVTTIGSSAFIGCGSLSSISVGSLNTSYSSSSGALFNKAQTNLIVVPPKLAGSFTVPGTVTTISDNAFYGCAGLTAVSLSSGITTVGASAFQNCTALTSIALPNTVTSVGASAFYGCSSLTSCTMSTGLTSLGVSAFQGCSALTAVSIPAGITSIGTSTFQGCGALFNLSLPGTLTSIGDSAFFNCSSLINLPAFTGLTSVGQYAFYNCSGLTRLSLAGSFTSVGQYTFYNCSGLASLSLPSTLTSIGTYAFYNCGGLTSLIVPSGVTSIGTYAFYNCSGLTGVNIPSGVTGIGIYTFYNCSGLTSISIPLGVTNIGDYAFYNCSGLTNLALSKNVASIGANTFTNCSGLTDISVDADNGDYSSLAGALYDKSQTTLLTVSPSRSGTFFLPASVTSVNTSAFSTCKYLTEITVDAANPNYSHVSGALYDKAGSKLIAVPPGKTGEFTVPSSVVTIGSYALQGCRDLSKVTIPAAVNSIGTSAFAGCSTLASIVVDPTNAAYSSASDVLFDKNKTTVLMVPAAKAGAYSVPSTVVTIGSYALQGCSGLTSLSIPSSVTTVGSYAIQGCSNLTSLTIAGSVMTTVGVGALQDCSSLTSLTLPSSVTSIGSYALQGCSSLTSIAIPRAVNSIGASVFSGCSRLASISADALSNYFSSASGALFDKNKTALVAVPAKVADPFVIPPTVTSISASAFHGCRTLTGIDIPDSVKRIGVKAFVNCGSLASINVGSLNACYSSTAGTLFNKDQSVLIAAPGAKAGAYTVPSTVTTVGASAFEGCSSLTSITLPSGVTVIGPAALSGCSGLTSLSLPSTLAGIGASAFYGCSGLTSLSLPSTLAGIGASTFYGCSGLTSLTIPSSVTGIGATAFYGCSSLTGLSIPAGVTGIGIGALLNCGSLEAISVDPLNSNYSSVAGALLDKGKTTLITAPSGIPAGYSIPNTVTTIGTSAFFRCNQLTSLSIPTSVRALGNPAFAECANLKSLNFQGNAPTFGTLLQAANADYKSYYFDKRTGFTYPVWAAYPSVRIPLGDSIHVLAGPSGAILFRGSNVFQRVFIDDMLSGGTSTSSYGLVASSGTGTALASGVVPVSGQVSMPLSGVSASGDYLVRINRVFADGSSLSFDSAPFHIELKSWADAAGSYELMLEDANGLIGDFAHYRGKVIATVSSTGAVSGRMLYNEAPHLEAMNVGPSPAWGLRSYVPVVRAFAGVFATAADGVNKAVRISRLGAGGSTTGQVLTLSVDFSTLPLRLKALVQDYASVPFSTAVPDGATSEGEATSSVRALSAASVNGGTSPAVNVSSAAQSRYALSSNAVVAGSLGVGSDNRAYLLFQALPSGSLLWTSRLAGYAASGSGLLRLSDALDGNSLSASIYEAQSASSATALSTTSLLGELQLTRDATTHGWSVSTRNGDVNDSLERQRCYVSKGLVNGSTAPVYSAADFAKGANWTGARKVDFSDHNATAWSLATGVFGALPALSRQPYFITAEDPLNRAKYVWRVVISPTGAVTATKYLPGTASQPALSMALDRARGEFLGAYTADGLVRSLRGVVLPGGGKLEPSAQGWAEAGALPTMQTGGWWMQQ